MAAPVSVPLTVAPDRSAIPPALFNVCFVLFVINVSVFPDGLVFALVDL